MAGSDHSDRLVSGPHSRASPCRSTRLYRSGQHGVQPHASNTGHWTSALGGTVAALAAPGIAHWWRDRSASASWAQASDPTSGFGPFLPGDGWRAPRPTRERRSLVRVATILCLPSRAQVHDRGSAAEPRRSSTPRSNGSTGSTTAGFWSRSAMCRRLKPKPPTTQPWRNLQHSPPDSNQPASEKLGTVQSRRSPGSWLLQLLTRLYNSGPRPIRARRQGRRSSTTFARWGIAS
jgi:hypothetical protein